MSDTKITLYHANWCGHCVNFLPTWKALKDVFNLNNIKHEEYEDSANPKVIKEANINGFPTIRISKNNKEYDYNGPRTPDDILHAVIPNLQIGGNNKTTKRHMINYKNVS